MSLKRAICNYRKLNVRKLTFKIATKQFCLINQALPILKVSVYKNEFLLHLGKIKFDI